MQPRPLLLLLAIVAVALAGCAQSPSSEPVSKEKAASEFAQAASSTPSKYGMDLSATKADQSLMSAQAVYDQTAKTSYFHLKFDPSVAKRMGSQGAGASGFDAASLGDLSIYSSPEGGAVLANGTVILTKPEQGNLQQAAAQQNGLNALTDPAKFMAAMKDQDFVVKNASMTTLNGKNVMKIDATITQKGQTQDITVWLSQDPTRVVRMQMMAPAGEAPNTAADPFAGALMTVDLKYDSDVTLAPPADLTRAMGLRYHSDKASFGGFGGSTGGNETWSFEASGGVALGDVIAEVGERGAQTAPEWTMALSQTTMSQGGVTLTYHDADGDGKVSKGDTLTIERTNDAAGLGVTLKDGVTGLRVVPGVGLALVGVAAIGALLLFRATQKLRK